MELINKMEAVTIMKKWFKELKIGDVLAEAKLKVGKDKYCYFDNIDCDYLKIVDIKKGSLFTINLATNQRMELVGAGEIDDMFNEPRFEVVEEIPKIEVKAVQTKPIQMSIFDII